MKITLIFVLILILFIVVVHGTKKADELHKCQFENKITMRVLSAAMDIIEIYEKHNKELRINILSKDIDAIAQDISNGNVSAEIQKKLKLVEEKIKTLKEGGENG